MRVRCLGSCLAFLMLFSVAEADPNIMIVLCDDLGYGDIGCFGSQTVHTPELDRFAQQSLKLTACYAAAPNCSPARTGLMTGRTPYRVGVYNWIPFLSPMHVADSELTIAALLKQKGYRTCQAGKWHLNGWFNLPGQPQPNDMGFDHYFATQNNALPNHRHPFNFVRDRIPVGPTRKYASELVVDDAINWLTSTQNSTAPFFMYVCFHEPHEPIATEEQYTQKYPEAAPSLAAHHGNITQMDANFGRLMRCLDQLNLTESTLVIFTSDNGPAMTRWHPHGSVGPLRSYKGHLYEGGIRVPGLIRWPGHISPGSVSDVPVCSVDFLPTCAELAKTQLPSDRVYDGTSLLPLFAGQPLARERPLYWQFNYARSWPKVAMRDGDWKLLAGLDPLDQGNLTDITSEQMEQLKTAQLEGFELYNLKADIGEEHNLIEQHPEQAQRLIARLREYYREVQQAGPTWPEWTWPRYESQLIEWPDYEKPKPK